MLRTILCNDCGHVMSRFRNSCASCTRTNLTYFNSPDAPELKARIKEIKSGPDLWTRLAAAGFLAALAFIFGYEYITAGKNGHAQQSLATSQTHVQTASSNHTIPR